MSAFLFFLILQCSSLIQLLEKWISSFKEKVSIRRRQNFDYKLFLKKILQWKKGFFVRIYERYYRSVATRELIEISPIQKESLPWDL